MTFLRHAAPVFVVSLLAACGGENSPSKTVSPGAEETTKTKLLEAGANLMQDKSPLNGLNAYLDGFHFESGDLKTQMEAHHYCGHVNEDVIQCVIFDGNDGAAKLIGLEYIVSKSVFEKLAPEEKHLWHSHVYEVSSGQLIAPGLPDAAEHELMEQIAGTYGKTWHTWPADQRMSLPIGPPMLMMGFTEDGQADAERVTERDRRFEVSSADKRAQRADISYPPIDPDADAWRKQPALQVSVRPVGSPH